MNDPEIQAAQGAVVKVIRKQAGVPAWKHCGNAA